MVVVCIPVGMILACFSLQPLSAPTLFVAFPLGNQLSADHRGSQRERVVRRKLLVVVHDMLLHMHLPLRPLRMMRMGRRKTTQGCNEQGKPSHGLRVNYSLTSEFGA